MVNSSPRKQGSHVKREEYESVSEFLGRIRAERAEAARGVPKLGTGLKAVAVEQVAGGLALDGFVLRSWRELLPPRNPAL